MTGKMHQCTVSGLARKFVPFREEAFFFSDWFLFTCLCHMCDSVHRGQKDSIKPRRAGILGGHGSL